MNFADTIKAAIRSSGKTVYAIAKGCGVDQPTLHRFLSGERERIRIDTAEKLCKYLGLELKGRGK